MTNLVREASLSPDLTLDSHAKNENPQATKAEAEAEAEADGEKSKARCSCRATALIVDDNAFNLIPLEGLL
eukprot:CAMPEP_0185588304 /NCGR_PEP_ID=MMETSP0434-20130131/52528_1 /TAXON_ID=626734 ORGANISM="Favella taraikaensis, Strain Fe Narragansett Bay" /NCGR_SAMPLE_ID=MMETSP0434 /ASSEMBLY_ACC=CAM_ASM_000379 /LENGTH=70 /DNA_ID=CAMNT_0028210847 /DNA_START=153 /DNA_END=364 /DNA_ORIENTATION=+